MGNLLSYIRCFSCQNRPNSMFGQKKRRKCYTTYPMTIITPLYCDFPIPITNLVNDKRAEENSSIYNNNPPHLVKHINTPLTIEYTTEPIEYMNQDNIVKLPAVNVDNIVSESNHPTYSTC